MFLINAFISLHLGKPCTYPLWRYLVLIAQQDETVVVFRRHPCIGSHQASFAPVSGMSFIS